MKFLLNGLNDIHIAVSDFEIDLQQFLRSPLTPKTTKKQVDSGVLVPPVFVEVNPCIPVDPVSYICQRLCWSFVDAVLIWLFECFVTFTCCRCFVNVLFYLVS